MHRSGRKCPLATLLEGSGRSGCASEAEPLVPRVVTEAAGEHRLRRTVLESELHTFGATQAMKLCSCAADCPIYVRNSGNLLAIPGPASLHFGVECLAEWRDCGTEPPGGTRDPAKGVIERSWDSDLAHDSATSQTNCCSTVSLGPPTLDKIKSLCVRSSVETRWRRSQILPRRRPGLDGRLSNVGTVDTASVVRRRRLWRARGTMDALLGD